MARYDNSWRTNVKSMFAPLPVNYMAQKLKETEQNRDDTESLLDGDYVPKYDELMTDDKYLMDKRQQYKNDLSHLRNSMLGSLDFTSTVNNIRKIRNKYDFTNGNGLNYTQTTSNGTTSHKSNKQQYNAGNQFVPGSTPYRLEANKQEVDNANEYYGKNFGNDADAYRYYYVDKPRLQVRQETGGDPDKQPLVHLDRVKQFDTNKFDGMISSMTHGFKEDGQAAIKYYGDWIYVGKQLIVTPDDVRGNERAGVFGFIWQNPEWNKHQEIMYDYGVERKKNINPEIYANVWLEHISENKIKQNYQQKYGSNWYNKYIQDYKNGTLNKLLEDNINDKINSDINTIKKEHPNMSDDDIKRYLTSKQYGLNGYKYMQANTLTDVQVRREAHVKTDITNLKLTPEAKLRYGKSLYDYKNRTNIDVTTTTPIDLPSDPKKRATVLQNSFTNQPVLKNKLIDAETTKQNAENAFNGLFKGNGLNFPGIDIGIGTIGGDDTQNFKFLKKNGYIVENANGTYMVNRNKMADWKTITGNPDLQFTTVQQTVMQLNNAKAEEEVRRTEYLTNEYQTATITNKWAKSIEGTDEINKLWNRISPNQDKQVNILVNGKQQSISKDDIPYLIKSGAILQYQYTNIYDYNNPNGSNNANRTINLNNYHKTISKWASDPHNVQGTDKIIFVGTGDINKDKSMSGVVANNTMFEDPHVAMTLRNLDGKSLQTLINDSGISSTDKNTKVKLIKTLIGANSGNNGLVYGLSYEITGYDSSGKKKTHIINMLVNETGLNQMSSGFANTYGKAIVNSYVYKVNTMRHVKGYLVNDQYSPQEKPLYEVIGNQVANRKSIFNNGFDNVENMLQNKHIDKTNIVYSKNGLKFYYKKVGKYAYLHAINKDGTDIDVTQDPNLNLNPIENGDAAYVQIGILESRFDDANAISKKDLYSALKIK